MRIVVAGGTGFIGQAVLEKCLERYGGELELTLITRRKEGAELFPPWLRPVVWDVSEAPPHPSILDNTDAVINLVGASVWQRWTAKVKQLIRDSRILSTRHLVEAMRQTVHPPKVLVNASATGYYGDRGDEELSEESPPGKGFLAEVCQLWEEEAKRATELGVRVVYVRLGVVLGHDGGALEKMLSSFEWGVSGRLGSGRQWMAWVHRTDAANLFLHAITNEQVIGAMNAVSPNLVTNREFARTLAKAVGKPALLAVPAFLLKLIFGEAASILLDSQKVLPKVALATGYRFEHPELKEALRHLLYWRREWLKRQAVTEGAPA